MPLEILDGSKIVRGEVCFVDIVDGSTLTVPPMQTWYHQDEHEEEVDFTKGKVAKFNFREELDGQKLRQAFVICPSEPLLRGCGGMRASKIEPGDVILLVFAVTLEGFPEIKRLTVVYNYTEDGLGRASFATHRIPDWETNDTP